MLLSFRTAITIFRLISQWNFVFAAVFCFERADTQTAIGGLMFLLGFVRLNTRTLIFSFTIKAMKHYTARATLKIALVCYINSSCWCCCRCNIMGFLWANINLSWAKTQEKHQQTKKNAQWTTKLFECLIAAQMQKIILPNKARWMNIRVAA